MTDAAIHQKAPGLDPAKFRDPDVTADGSARASVALEELQTLWFNTGTLCNLECVNCYIESSPTNDRLQYLPLAEAERFLDELDRDFRAVEIGFTGGEPFMNPDFMAMLESALDRGYRALVLTNAMRPMMKRAGELLALRERFGERLHVRVSIDHYSRELHDLERGAGAWERMLPGLDWLAANGFRLSIAGRTFWKESEDSLREGFGRFLAARGIGLDAGDPERLVLFPENNGRSRPGHSGRSPRTVCAKDSDAFSRPAASASTPATRNGWCCSRRWTPPPTCRRSPPPAGAYWTCSPRP